MAEQKLNPRAQSAKAHDDSQLLEEEEALGAPSQSGVRGGNVARDVSSRDEQKRATGDAGLTRVSKRDKPQPATRTRSDHQGG